MPAPTSLHEALAAFIGARAWPAQIWPEGGSEDSLPGGAFFASIGGFLARTISVRGAIRAQAGALDLASEQEGVGPRCATALRLYGALPFLDVGAPHLLADAFHPDRWWKLIDLHRDPALAEALDAELVVPLLREGPSGSPRLPAWDAHLDGIPVRALPSFREPPRAEDHDLALLARRALLVRTSRTGRRFASAIQPTELTLDLEAGELRSAWSGPDAIGAPARHPWPPSLCGAAAILPAWPASS